MNWRSAKLLGDARGQECKNCGRNDGTTVCAHSNWSLHGKGKSIKAHDCFTAWLCFACHAWLDQGGNGADPTGVWQPTREDKMEMWRRAFERTTLARFEAGLVVAA